MTKYLTICLILTAGSLGACASCPAHTDIILPPRPLLAPVDRSPITTSDAEQRLQDAIERAERQQRPLTLWDLVPTENKTIWTRNDLKLKSHAKRLEERIAIHNED